MNWFYCRLLIENLNDSFLQKKKKLCNSGVVNQFDCLFLGFLQEMREYVVVVDDLHTSDER